ncbi:clumping factor B [Beauveria brongniartii RCEF 3172]|uniref:Clumping factor B n=1 Tax=Beauveria brongniartii RCEF 3172 TaxID=1081107 RepID=A0A162M532_9HYPO|nr:clumping factor B [Beauveria brongniartii RCEF 3172]
MSFDDIRLRLVIRRHTVPDVKLVWPCSPSDDLTIAKLLGQVNEVVPLEGGEWGLEDYVAELGDGSNGASFECLHFQLVSRILKDEDQVLIRPLLSDDLKRRRRSGRHQISTGGKHLVDGIAFGRPWLHLPADRPALELPPRKRARIAFDDEDGEDDDEDAESEFEADWDSNNEPDADDAEHASGSSFEEEQGGDDLMQELELLKQDRRDISEASSDNEDVGFGLLPMLDSMAALRMAFPNIPSFIVQQELRRQNQDVQDAYKALSQSYGPTLSFDEMMDSVLTASRPSNTPVAARVKSLGEESPAKPSSGRRLIEVVESKENEEEEANNESGKVVGLGIRDIDVGLDSESNSGDDTSDSDSHSDSSGGASYTQDAAVAEDDSDDETGGSGSNSDTDSSFGSDSGNEIATAKSRNSSDSRNKLATAKSRNVFETGDSSESESDSSDSDSNDSSDDSDAGPMEISTSRIQTIPKAAAPPTPSVVVPAVDPGCGLSKTQKRNARRKRSKQMRASVSGSQAIEDSMPDETMAELETLKASLLSSLDNGSWPISLKPSGSEPSDKAPAPATNGVEEPQTNGEPAGSSPRKLNLDTGASRRLLFGALGLKTPKNKADEEKIKQGLMKGVKPLTNKRLVEDVEEPVQRNTVMEDDSWRDKINYRAVECGRDGIVLSEPPFPFVQRWDPQQQYNSMRKRKRQSQHYGDYDDSLVYDVPAVTASNKKKKTRQRGLEAEDGPELTNGHADDAGVVADLPPLPSDLTSLVALEHDAVTPGQLITWKQLSMSKATSWQPQLASFTGVVLSGSDGNSLNVILAKRDRETNDHVYDEHTGQRVYEKFEAPDLDEEDSEVDDGHRTVKWFEMMEPRLIPGSAPEGFVEMTNGADATEEVSAGKNLHTSTEQPETQQSRAETLTSADGAESASINSAQRPHHFELPLADDGVMSAASDSLDTGRTFGVRQQSHDHVAPESPGEGRQQREAAADKVATDFLSGQPSLDNEAETTADAQDTAQPKAATKKGNKSKTRMAAPIENDDVIMAVPSSLASDAPDDGESGDVDAEIGESMAGHDDGLIPETLIDAAAVPSTVRDRLSSSPFDSLEELFVSASSSRRSLDATASSLPVMPTKCVNDVEYEEAMRRLDNDELDSGSQTLFPNATQPKAVKMPAAAAAAAPAVRSSPRRQAKTKKSGWVLPEGSQVITLGSSPVQRRPSPAAARRRSPSLQL